MSDNTKQESKKSSPIDLGLDGEPVRYTGACHCQKIQFEFEHAEIREVRQCNCSICKQRGSLYVYTPGDRFRLTSGSLDDMTEYMFNRRILKHYFCAVCGCAPFGKVVDGKVVGINARSLIDFDLGNMAITHFDGASA